MKKWYTSRTVQVFGAVAVIAAALIAENLFSLDLETGIQLREAAGAAVGAAIAIALRFVTSTGVEL